MKKLTVALTLCFSFMASANLEGFNKRFDFVRENGKLIAVRDRSISTSFSVKQYLNYIKNELLTEQSLMNSLDKDYEQSILELFEADEESLESTSNKNLVHISNSMKALGAIDFESIFSNPAFLEVFEKYESKLRDTLFYIDPQLVAKPDNSSFYYKKNVTYNIVSQILNYAAKKLSTIPVLNTASYAITQIEKMMSTRRMYQQNLLLHYLELHTPEQLGLTKDEVDQIFSSIYESRINWIAFWESADAKLDWANFGANRFYQNFRLGTNKIRSFKSTYDSMDARVNYAFHEVTFKGERVIVNLVDAQNMMDKRPAIAYSFDNPNKIRRQRSVLTLARLGLSFVTLPAIIKDIAHDYIKSYYEAQQVTEGALVAHFEMTGDLQEKEKLQRQFINAYSVR